MPSLKLSNPGIPPKTTAVFPDDLIYLVDGAPTSHSMTFGNMAYEVTRWWDVRNYGAIGNGVVDDTPWIQATIDAARAGGGIVYMPPGTYAITNALQIWDAHNITLRGAGKSTIIDATAATVLTKVRATQGEWGVIMIAPTAGGGVPLNHITLQDFTLLSPATLNHGAKSVYVGATNSCTLRRLYVTGAPYECLYCDPYVGLGYSATNWVVEGCEIANFSHNGINDNTIALYGLAFINNYLHDGVCGINVISKQALVQGNHIEDCHTGIIATEDMAGDGLQSIQIIGNRLVDIGKTGTPAIGSVGIWATATGGLGDYGILIANNVVGPIYNSAAGGAYGIRTTGPCVIKGNILSGVREGTAKGNYQRAIYVEHDAFGGTTEAIIEGNVIEAAVPATDGWSAGIFVENDSHITAHLANNVVRPGAMRAGHPFGSYHDERGASTLNGDVFYDWFTIGPTVTGAMLNAAGEMDGKPLHYGDINAGAPVAAKATAWEWGDGLVHKTVLTFTLTGANDLDLANGADHGTGVKVYGFPEGRIHIIGATINALTINNGAFNADPNDVFYLSCGSVIAADDGTLTGTEADIIPATTMDTAGGAATVLWWRTALGASVEFDGTGTALALYVNAAVADACTSGAVTIAITGTMTIHWINLGDY